MKLVDSAIFANFLPLKKALGALPSGKNVTLDLSNAYLIDHTVMEYFHDFKHDYESDGGHCQQIGDTAHTYSDHELSARLMTKKK